MTGYTLLQEQLAARGIDLARVEEGMRAMQRTSALTLYYVMLIHHSRKGCAVNLAISNIIMIMNKLLKRKSWMLQ